MGGLRLKGGGVVGVVGVGVGGRWRRLESSVGRRLPEAAIAGAISINNEEDEDEDGCSDHDHGAAARSLASLLRSCRSLPQCRETHARMADAGLPAPGDGYLTNLLLQSYGNFGAVDVALSVFDRIPTHLRDVFSWNLLISACARNGLHRHALRFYNRMLSEASPEPDKFTFLPALSASANANALDVGRGIHDRISRSPRLRSDVTLQTALISMYAKCGRLSDARLIFDCMHRRDRISWNAMVAAYARSGLAPEAAQLFRQMLSEEGANPGKGIYLCLLNACANPESAAIGMEIHEAVSASEWKSDLVVQNALLHMYGKSHGLEYAESIFEGMHKRDVISWSTMMAAYVYNGQGKRALDLFRRMRGEEGVKPDKVTFLCALNACAGLVSLESGRPIHELAVASGYGSDITVNNAVISMYGKCGSLEDARLVFDSMHERDVVSWTSMLASYAQNGRIEDAVELLRGMELQGIAPDKNLFLCLLTACANAPSLECGRAIHRRIRSSAFEADTAVNNALLNMYGKCGSPEDVKSLFDRMSRRDVISWSAMLGAYASVGRVEDALALFPKMNSEGVEPDRRILLALLNACADVASLESGRAIHKHIVAASGGLESDIALNTALLTMYGKCGSLADAWSVFTTAMATNQQDAIMWNAMLVVLGLNGHGKEARNLFWQMETEKVKPDRVTFLCLINACSHAGLPDIGWECFVSMNGTSDGYSGVTPSRDQYVSMVDLSGRAKDLNGAEDIVKNMPFKVDVVAWRALLCPFLAHGDAQGGVCTAEKTFANGAPHRVSLLNTYASD